LGDVKAFLSFARRAFARGGFRTASGEALLYNEALMEATPGRAASRTATAYGFLTSEVRYC